jgi:hypothetical protein
MTALTVTYCRPVVIDEQFTGPAGEAITVGQYVRLNTTTGKVELGNASALGEAADGGIALHAAAVAEAVTVVRKGILDMGEALVGLAFNALVYLSDTDGTLADGTGTKTKVLGEVVPGWANTTADKLLRLNQRDAFTP